MMYIITELVAGARKRRNIHRNIMYIQITVFVMGQWWWGGGGGGNELTLDDNNFFFLLPKQKRPNFS